ncbi:hypothetical protein TNCV_4826681 [Trichonephila clavipes]|nr:hypothetical protein TNCV_4826681 [Trichonephila clavipes]
MEHDCALRITLHFDVCGRHKQHDIESMSSRQNKEDKNHRVMMEAGWSARRVTHQVGHSNLTVRSCCEQSTEDTSFTWRPGSGRPRQISRLEDRHII